MRRIILLFLSLSVFASACGTDIRLPFDISEGYSTNGARIYFTATSDSGQRISYSGGPRFGGMMMGGQLNCASCHGDDGRGGAHFMHMDLMQVPDITFAELNGGQDEHGDNGDGHSHDNEGYDLEDFSQAVVIGFHPDGQSLDNDMPRWKLSDEDLSDLFDFIVTLP